MAISFIWQFHLDTDSKPVGFPAPTEYLRTTNCNSLPPFLAEIASRRRHESHIQHPEKSNIWIFQGVECEVNGTLTATDNAAIGTTVSSTRQLNVLGGTTDDYAGYFQTADTTHATGVYGGANGATNQAVGYAHYGVDGVASGARYNYGLSGSTNDSGAYSNTGVNGYAFGATYNYGVYGYASGGTTNYAGYFSGDTRVTGLLQYGTIAQYSDERLKENIKPVENALTKVAAINGVYYNMKDNPEQTEVGVIAQDVQKVLPEAVMVLDKENGYLGVSYPSLIPVLIEAVKELKADNEAKDLKIEALAALVCQDHPEAALCQ